MIVPDSTSQQFTALLVSLSLKYVPAAETPIQKEGSKMTQIIRNFHYVLPLVILLLPAVILVGFLIYRKRRKRLAVKDALTTVLIDMFLLLSVAGILIVTLFPRRIVYAPVAARVQIIPFADVTNISPYVLIENIVFNILLFIPFGFFASWRLSSAKVLRRILPMGMCFSLCIELLQLLMPIGRSTTVDDIILNTLGTVIGSLFYLLISRVLPKSLAITAFTELRKKAKGIQP